MTNGHNFKVGDRAYIKNNGICTIIVIDDKKWLPVEIERADRSRSRFGRDSLEDVKTVFLTRLQSLLREFDATIGYFIGDDEKYGWCDYPFLTIGDEIVKYPAGDIDEITADNIMNFDKS